MFRVLAASLMMAGATSAGTVTVTYTDKADNSIDRCGLFEATRLIRLPTRAGASL